MIQQVVLSCSAPLAMIFPLLSLKCMKRIVMSSNDPRSFRLNHLQQFAPSILWEQYTVGNYFASFLTLTQTHFVVSSSICLVRKHINRPHCCYLWTQLKNFQLLFKCFMVCDDVMWAWASQKNSPQLMWPTGSYTFGHASQHKLIFSNGPK